MNQSETVNKLFESLIKAHLELPVVAKNARAGKENDKFSYKYADLADVIKECNPILSKFGLTVIHRLNFDQDSSFLETMLIHSSGEFISCKVKIIPDKEDIKGFGAAITYLRRYSYSALVGITTDEDDDANAAAGDKSYSFEKKNSYTVKESSPLTTNTLNKDQVEILERELEDRQEIKDLILTSYKVKTLHQVPAHAFEGILKKIRR